MRTSATGISTDRNQRGFTLLEVMVTLVLIGIVTGFVVLSVRGGNPNDRIETEARRLATLIDIHRQEAILRTEVHGLRFSENGYEALVLNQDDEWVSSRAGTESKAPEYRLPEGITLAVSVENRSLDLSEPTPWPHIVLFASGEVTDFNATFYMANALGYTVTGDPTGTLKLGPGQ